MSGYLTISAPQVDESGAVYRVRIHNDGSVPVVYELAVLADPDAPLAALHLPDRVTVSPGRELDFSLRIEPPRDPSGTSIVGSYSFHLQATPTTAPADRLTVQGVFVIVPPLPIMATVAPTWLELIDPTAPEATAQLTLINPLQRPVAVVIDVAPAAVALYRVELSQRRLALPPLSERSVTLTIQRAQTTSPIDEAVAVPFQIELHAVKRASAISLRPAGAQGSRQHADPAMVPDKSVRFTPIEPVTVSLQPAGLAVELMPTTQTTPPGLFHIVLTNQGERMIPAVLALNTLGRPFTYQFEGYPRRPVTDTPASAVGYPLTLPPHSRLETTLRLQPTRLRIGGPTRPCPFMLTVAVGGRRIDALAQRGTLLDRPLSPWLVVAPLVLLMLAGGLWAILRDGERDGAVQAATSIAGAPIAPQATLVPAVPTETASAPTQPLPTTTRAVAATAPTTAAATTAPMPTSTAAPAAPTVALAVPTATLVRPTAAPPALPTATATPAIQALRSWLAHSGAVRDVAFSATDQLVATTSVDTTVRIWRTSDNSLVGSPLAHLADVYTVAFSPFDAEVVATGAADGYVRLWRTSQSQPVWRQFQGGNIASVAFSPVNRQLLAAGGGDGSVRLWQVSDGRQLRVLGNGLGAVESIAFSRDGAWLAASTKEGRLYLWPVASQQAATEWDAHPLRPGIDSWVEALAFSNDGRILASGSHDQTVRLWNAPAGTPLGEPLLIGDEIKALTFAGPDSRWLAVATTGNELQIWLVRERRLVMSLPGHTSGILGVTASHDGRLLATASNDRTVRLWSLSEAR